MADVLIVLQNESYPYDTRTRQHAEALVAAGHGVTVVGPTGYGFHAAEETVGGVRVLRARAPAGGQAPLGYLREYALSMWRLGRLARAERRRRRPDVQLVCSPPMLVALAYPRRGSGLVVDYDDLYPELFESKFERRGPLHRALRLAERLALRRADAVLVPNPAYAEVARRRVGVDAGAVFVVGNGPDPARIHAVEPDPSLKAGREELVLWVGNMSSQEGLDVLVDAAERVLAERDATFAVVGPGDARAALEADVARRGLADRIVFPGLADDDLMRRYLSTADVCVSTDATSALNDVSSMTKVLEYMAVGRAVVQFPLGEMRRACRDATLYARDGDPVDLAERILELLRDPALRADLGRRAREQAAPLLWPAQVPRFLAAVERAARG